MNAAVTHVKMEVAVLMELIDTRVVVRWIIQEVFVRPI
jgi:hypothetical protein